MEVWHQTLPSAFKLLFADHPHPKGHSPMELHHQASLLWTVIRLVVSVHQHCLVVIVITVALLLYQVPSCAQRGELNPLASSYSFPFEPPEASSLHGQCLFISWEFYLQTMKPALHTTIVKYSKCLCIGQPPSMSVFWNKPSKLRRVKRCCHSKTKEVSKATHGQPPGTVTGSIIGSWNGGVPPSDRTLQTTSEMFP